MTKQYAVNEIYRTLHGEGVRFGIPHIFVRLAFCNLTCGFCDTEFESYRAMTAQEILEECRTLALAPPAKADFVVVPEGTKRAVDNGPKAGPVRNVLFCGGEPLAQLDAELIAAFKQEDDPWFICTETNGTKKAPAGIDWITCSPKVAEHAIRLQRAHEVKYVRGYGQAIPKPKLVADHYLISPMFEANQVDDRVLNWCIALVAANPGWRLTVQHHKLSFGNMR
jgi:7-carboxy-7-deazaguanine synthase